MTKSIQEFGNNRNPAEKSYMSNGSGLAVFGIALAIGLGLYSCNKYDGMKYEGLSGSERTSVQIEKEKTKQLELQLKLKGCQ